MSKIAMTYSDPLSLVKARAESAGLKVTVCEWMAYCDSYRVFVANMPPVNSMFDLMKKLRRFGLELYAYGIEEDERRYICVYPLFED